eukprot:TRINITY_DN5377_c0_g1_i1.p1 TRINITY_DN5377_c0_g1~~TRINITY_DN5377_c0_g1_i1.p1  ORF type:complete len:268 (-),score=54.04 TRINITY_DN5377_c0_g1_i1:3-806(-)
MSINKNPLHLQVQIFLNLFFSASFAQREQTQNTNFAQNNIQSEMQSNKKVLVKQDSKVQRIMETINQLDEVKSSCKELIEAGSAKMENNYQQCIATVKNFNCSYSKEWEFLKIKHKNNITLLEEEIKAKDQTIELIKEQIQKKSQGKSALIKQIMPEITKIEKDIGQVELIIELIQEIQQKQNNQQTSPTQPQIQTPVPPPQVLIKNHEKKQEQSQSVSYTHLTLPTKRIVQISVVAISLKKKNKTNYIYRNKTKDTNTKHKLTRRI